MNYYTGVLKKYAEFGGRATRKEFWMFVLFNLLFVIAFNIVDVALDINLFGPLYGLAVFLPFLALSVRRLHDTGRSGWWVLLGIIPLIGFIVLIVFYIQNGQPGPNQYGPDPKEAASFASPPPPASPENRAPNPHE